LTLQYFKNQAAKNIYEAIKHTLAALALFSRVREIKQRKRRAYSAYFVDELAKIRAVQIRCRHMGADSFLWQPVLEHND
jgi:hypothetical protein